jgi:hypothetical protein
MKLSKNQEKELIKKYGHVPTEKEIFENLKAHQEKLMSALVGALETAPDDPEIRKQLMEAVEKATQMREKLYKEIIKEPSPPIKKPK